MKDAKPILGYETRYLVTEYGEVISTNYKNTGKKHKLKLGTSHNGYLQVGLFDGEKQKSFRVHRLVATAFIGKPPTRNYQVNHKDGDKLNNHYSNLEWCTYHENHIHAIKHGLRFNVGEKHGNAKLSNDQVLSIKKDLSLNALTQRQIAAKHNVHYTCINHIAKGRQWNHIKNE